jgi:hypothetical protein
VIWEERRNARIEFRRRHPRRNGRAGAPYPPGMEEIQPFAKWFEIDVQQAKDHGIAVPDDVEDSSRPPSLQAQRFRSMYSYGYHFRVKSAEESVNSTCDSGVAGIFRRPCRSGMRDPNPVDANLEYIGQILEIVELNYGRHCVVVLDCEWVKANYRGRNATVKKDEWGFTMANFNALVPHGYESFAFPIHCEQVFFSDDEDEPGWRVVLRTEVRGRRIDNTMEEEDEAEIFAMGRDIDFEGLRAPAEIPETDPAPLPTGRNIRMPQIVEQMGEANAEAFDNDVEESSEEEEHFW